MSTKETLPTHSEIPWYWKPSNDGLRAHRICSKEGVIIADALWHSTNRDIAPLPPMAKANADFIVEACNNYASLRTRLDAAEKELFSTHDLFDRAHKRAELAEKELEQLKERLSEVSKGTLMVENLRLKEANADGVRVEQPQPTDHNDA